MFLYPHQSQIINQQLTAPTTPKMCVIKRPNKFKTQVAIHKNTPKF